MAENIQIKINAAVESAQAATTIGQLKSALVELQDIAENNDLGAEQFQALQTQIVSTNTDLAAARDRIGDIQDSISTLQGTPIERVRNSFGLLREAVFNLDFDKAKIGVQGLVNAFTPLGPDGLPLKGLAAMKGALGNLTGAASQLGTTFINLGRTLLTNPIFLLATVITTIIVGIGLLLNKLGLLEPIFDAIGKAVEYVTDSFNQLTESIGINTAATDKNLKATLAAEQEKRKALEETLQVQEAVAEAAKGLNSQEQKDIEKISGAYLRSGKDIVDIRNEALNKIKISLQEEAKAYEDVAKTKRKLTNEEKKSYDEIVLKIAETNTKIAALNAERVRQTNELRDQNRLNAIALEEDELTRAKLLRDEEIRIAKSNQDQLNELSRKAKEAEEAALQKRKMAYTREMMEEVVAEEQKAKQIRDLEQESIKARDIAIADANKKFNKTQQQLQEEAARKSQDNFQKRVKFELEELKRKGEAELLDAEGFELKQLEIKNKYIKLTEEFQLRNTKVFFESELQKNNFIKNNAQQILDNNIKISEIEEKRQQLLEKAGRDARQAELTSIANQDRTLVGLEKELADNRILLTITRDRFDLEIKQAERALNTLKNSQGAAEKQKEIAAAELNLATLKINAETELGKIKESIRKIDQEAIIRVQAERANDIQAEINALQTLLNEKIKVDDATLSSRENTIKLVEELETASEERLKELRGLSVEGQIDLLNRIEQKKKEQIDNDELTLRLERSNIQDFSDFETQLAALSVAEQREFNAQRLANEKETSDAAIELTKQEVEAKRAERMKERDDMIQSAGMALSAIQRLTNLSFENKRKQLKKGSKEDEEAARKQFQINKALNIATAVVQGVQSILAITSVPDFTLGVASAIRIGAQIALNAASIAAIASQKFEYSGGGSAPSLPSINGSTPTTTALPSTFTAPTFFGLGEGTQQTMVGPNQQRVYVVETDITSTQNRVAVIENRSVIQ